MAQRTDQCNLAVRTHTHIAFTYSRLKARPFEQPVRRVANVRLLKLPYLEKIVLAIQKTCNSDVIIVFITFCLQPFLFGQNSFARTDVVEQTVESRELNAKM